MPYRMRRDVSILVEQTRKLVPDRAPTMALQSAQANGSRLTA